MARCGCGTVCNCSVTVDDTSTLDLHITGNGSSEFPYVITGDVTGGGGSGVGPTGPTGPTGASGLVGATGVTGTNGADGATGVGAQDRTFTYAGALVSGTTSPPIRLRFSKALVVLAVTLGTAGSTSTVLDVLKNGVSFATITITAGTTSHNEALAIAYTADVDLLALRVTTAGTGAADMTADARFT